MGYFKEKHQSWTEQWLTANTRQQFYLYSKLCGVINDMIQIISNRYFSIPFAKQKLFYQETLNHVFINLYKYNPKRQRAFSYISVLIKHKLYDLQVAPTIYENNVKLEFPEDFEAIPYSDEEPEIPLFNADALKLRFKELRLQVNHDMYHQQLDRKKRGYPIIPRPKGDSLLQVLDLCEKYLDEFNDFSSYNVSDFIFSKTELGRGTIAMYLNELFDYGAVPSKIREGGGYSGAKGDKSVSIVQDDITPIEDKRNKSTKMSKQRRKSVEEYLYF